MAREDFKPRKGGRGNMLLSPRTLAQIQEVAARPEVVMDAVQFVAEKRAGKLHYRLRQDPAPPPNAPGTPPPFLLSRGATGPRIRRGKLEWSVTTLHYEREDGRNFFTGQDEIPGVEEILPAPFDSSGEEAGENWAKLDWWGDVYLEWEVDPETCEVTAASITGPDEPDLLPLPRLEESLTREGTESHYRIGYFLKLGTVPEEGKIEQERTGNVHWAATFIPENPASSESESSESSSVISSSVISSSEISSSEISSVVDSSPSVPSESESGTEKSSTAIVRAPWEPTGYCALATVESNQVRFEFLMEVRLTGRETRIEIDPRWRNLCEPGSLRVAAAPNGDRPFPVCAVVDGRQIVLRGWPLLRPRTVTIQLTGIRKGFHGWNLPPRTAAQYEANERSLQAMYPR